MGTHEELRGLLRRSARRLLWTRAMESAACGAIAGGLCAAALQGLCLLGGLDSVGPWSIPAVAIPGGALAGAILRLVRPVTLRQAGVWLDARGGLAEQCATAAELLDSPAAEQPIGRFVCENALAALRNRNARKLTFWRRTRATAGALALTVLLCLALALLPAPRRPGAWEKIASSAASMTAEQRRQASADLLRAAEQADDDPQLAEKLAQAAAAVAQDQAELVRIDLDELRAALREAPKPVADAVTKALLASVTGTEGAGEGGAAGAEISQGPATVPAAAGEVTVYDPLYQAPAGSAASTGAAPGEARVPYRDAWSAARDRAEAALRSGQIPPEYLALVRAYFLGE